MIDLTILILNYNTKKLSIDCIKSILTKKWESKIRIVLIDNASSDDSVKAVKEKFGKRIEIIESKKNLGFTGGNNLGLRKYYKDSRYCLLLNSDTVISKNSLDVMVKIMDKRKDYGILSCRLINPDGNFQPNAGRLPSFFPMFFWLSGLDDILGKFIKIPSYQERRQSFYQGTKDVGWVSGSVMMIRSTLIKEIGFFDEKIFMYGEDVDFCWRAMGADFKVGWTDKAKIEHIGGASSLKPRYTQWLGEFRGLSYLYRKYYGSLAFFILKLFLYIFIFIRIIAFWIVGRKEYAETYTKIIKEI